MTVGGGVPRGLRELMEPAISRSRVLGMRATPRLRRLAEALFALGLDGALRTLFMEGAVLQPLAVQAAAGEATAAVTRTAISEREFRAVEDAHQLLLRDMRHPPTLGALAAAVGQSRLLALRPLDAWGEVWHALSRLADETERFSLDERQAVVSGLAHLDGS